MSRFLFIAFIVCMHSCILVSGAVIPANRKRSNHMPDKVYQIFRPQIYYRDNQANRISTISHIDAHVFGGRYRIELVLNRQLVANNFQHTFQNQQGSIERYQGSTELCHYQGRLLWFSPTNETVPLKSEVILSACNGLNGMVMFDNKVFIVEPRNERNNIEGEHVIFEEEEFEGDEYPDPLSESTDGTSQEQHEDENEDDPEGHNEHEDEYDDERENEEEHEDDEKERRRMRRRTVRKTKFIELVIVNDKRFVDNLDGNLKAVENHAIQIVNLVDAMYKAINIRVALVGMVTWNVKDEIAISRNSKTTLQRLSLYRSTGFLKNISNDNVQLLTGIIFTDGAGRAWQSTMCKYYSTGANYAFENIARAAAFMARNIGHNLGMRTDRYGHCSCRKNNEITKGCIMSSQINGPPALSFSPCSVKDLKKAFQEGVGQCLTNKPSIPKPKPVCGNGIVEKDEQCECASKMKCTELGCNPKTCKFHPVPPTSTMNPTNNVEVTQSQAETVKTTQRPTSTMNPTNNVEVTQSQAETVKTTQRPTSTVNPTNNVEVTQSQAETAKTTQRPTSTMNPTNNVEVTQSQTETVQTTQLPATQTNIATTKKQSVTEVGIASMKSETEAISATEKLENVTEKPAHRATESMPQGESNEAGPNENSEPINV